MNDKTISIDEYLSKKGIHYQTKGNELITKCLFNNCDADSKDNEAHLYFSINTSQFHCKKCNVVGNIFTLAKHFGDEPESIFIEKHDKKQVKDISAEVEKYHNNLPENIVKYLEQRGINFEIIKKYKIGYGRIYGKFWITIPIKNILGDYSYFKLRKDPFIESNSPKYITYPKNSQAQLFGYDFIESIDQSDHIIICEGEFDKLILEQNGIRAISSTHGAGTFKKEWVEIIEFIPKIYVCYDSDTAGEKGVEKVLKLLHESGHKNLNKINLPLEYNDITEYFSDSSNTIDSFLTLSETYPKKIDTSRFKPLTPAEIIETLELTIKYDNTNKLVAFLCQLSAFTEDSQFNINFNAPSSTGKSYIPTQVARLFPQDAVVEISYCSPTAFFHDYGEYDKDTNTFTVDLSNKIIIFLDQPHTQLLERLRPLLSHDKKEFILKITDKNQKHGTRTKNITLIGYPSVIFCTAGLILDEQEATRFLLLSPEVNQEKLYQGINATINREANKEQYDKWLNENPNRKLLKERIEAIRLENIKDVNIENKYAELIKNQFIPKGKTLKPRHQRDIKRLISIIKSLALVNLWWRKRDGQTIYASEEDIKEGIKIWDEISVSQELNIPPYVYNFYKEILLPAYTQKNEPLNRQEVLNKHYDVYGRILPMDTLRHQLLPMLETAGLIEQAQDSHDKRQMLITPHIYQNNGVMGGGVNSEVKKVTDEEIMNTFDVDGEIEHIDL